MHDADEAILNERAGELLYLSEILAKGLLGEGLESRAETLHAQLRREVDDLRDPVARFRIFANLYLYTWNCADSPGDGRRSGLEASAHYLRCLDRLRSTIAPAHYAELYKTWVTRAILERLEERFGQAKG